MTTETSEATQRVIRAWLEVCDAMAPLTVEQKRRVVDALEFMVDDMERPRLPGEKAVRPVTIAAIAAKLRGAEVPS